MKCVDVSSDEDIWTRWPWSKLDQGPRCQILCSVIHVTSSFTPRKSTFFYQQLTASESHTPFPTFLSPWLFWKRVSGSFFLFSISFQALFSSPSTISFVQVEHARQIYANFTRTKKDTTVRVVDCFLPVLRIYGNMVMWKQRAASCAWEGDCQADVACAIGTMASIIGFCNPNALSQRDICITNVQGNNFS